jgi:acyl-CoA synthetase (NDP forming)
MQNFRSLGFTGQVAGVNPRHAEVLGFPCYPTLADVPFVPDAVLLAVSRERVIGALEQAAHRGARGAVVFGVGFGEADDLGRELEARLKRIARDANMAVIGPNCQGLINFWGSVPLYIDSVVPYEPGAVGLIAQSGSVLTALVNNRRGVRWGHVISTGNEAVVDTADVVRYYVDNPKIAVVCGFLEIIRHPEAFLQQCDRARAAGKPVIVCRTGRTAASRQAATAHSGALAAPDRLIDAMLRRHDVIRAESLEELLETAIAMQSRRRPHGAGMAVVSTSGGQIGLLHDNLPGTALEVPEFAPATRTALADVVAPIVRTTNPLDWWGTPDPDAALPQILDVVAADPQIDIVLQVSDFTAGPTGVHPRARRPVEAAKHVLAARQELFVVVDTVDGAAQASDVAAGLADDVLVLSGLRSGIRALGHLVEYERSRNVAHALPAAAGPEPGFPTSLAWSPDVLELLRSAGFTMARGSFADTIEGAVAVAAELGYPLVAKIANEGIAHKSDLGGVLLNLRSADEVAAAADRLFRLGATRIEVQEQILGGTELFLGLQSEPHLGTFILAGLGGIWTELVDDIQIRPAGLREGEAWGMVRELRSYEQLMGARGGAVVSRDAITSAIMRLDLVGRTAGKRIQSLDINPLIIRGEDAIVVDALLVEAS